MDLRATPRDSLIDKLGRLMTAAGIETVIRKKDQAAVKLHFGERGNIAFIRPVFLRKIVDVIRDAGAEPFLTDANTLYAGTRSNASQHIRTAVQNGFAYSVVDAPIIIADGLTGKSEIPIPIKGKRFKEVYIASEIIRADTFISVAHFKCHELSGFGGALKNVGMGCASRRGKLAMHSTVSPRIKKKRCVGCGDCVIHCSRNAISLEEKKAVMDLKKCIGCGECILFCTNDAIQIRWNQTIPVFLENMMEYTLGVLKDKKGKMFFINFITDISPACDCLPSNDAPIVRDIGIVASTDPVAIDQASADLVNKETVLPGSCIAETRPDGDKFKAVYPKVDWELQLDYAEKLGLGTRNYSLETLDTLYMNWKH